MANTGRAFYTGVFEHTLDDKNRLTIPSAWRWPHAEEDIFLATPHPEGYVAVLPPDEVEKLRAKISQTALTDADAQDALAAFFAQTLSFTFDKQGRFGVSSDLVKHAEIDDSAVLVGRGNLFLIYSPARWAKVKQRTAGDNLGDMMRRIGL